MQLKKPSALRSRIAKISLTLTLGASALTAPMAWAGSWNAQPETLSNHPTWIYTPSTAMNSGKRSLLVVLHGCDQSHDQLKQWGNLAAAAEAKGAVIAVPWVGSKPWPMVPSTKCWDYDGANDGSGHIAELVQLTSALAARQALNIDPKHVYISGMSSGASVAMAAGCKAPDVFAGVNAVAGPSIGSSQMQAITDGGSITHTPETALAKCKSLAGSAKLQYFSTQIANIGYGEKDKNAEFPGCSFSAGSTSCPGTFQLVSKKWSTINAEMYRQLYGANALGAAVKVNNDALNQEIFMGEHREGKAGRGNAVSLTRVYNVGHAWPAGSGLENDAAKGGVWMAQKGMNYGQYLLSWFYANNPRDTGKPEITLCKAERAGETGFTVSAAGIDRDGTIVSYKVEAIGPGGFVETTGSGTSLSKTYAPIADGDYDVKVSATDNEGKTSDACTASVSVGKVLPPSIPTGLVPSGSTKDSVTLAWTAVKGAAGYHVYRNGQRVTTQPVPAATHTDNGLAASTTYSYTVSAVNAAGESAQSAPVQATTKSDWICTEHYSSNYTHVSQGRAYHSLGYAKAKGSDQNMGLYTMFHYSRLAHVREGRYEIGTCPK